MSFQFTHLLQITRKRVSESCFLWMPNDAERTKCHGMIFGLRFFANHFSGLNGEYVDQNE